MIKRNKGIDSNKNATKENSSTSNQSNSNGNKQ